MVDVGYGHSHPLSFHFSSLAVELDSSPNVLIMVVFLLADEIRLKIWYSWLTYLTRTNHLTVHTSYPIFASSLSWSLFVLLAYFLNADHLLLWFNILYIFIILMEHFAFLRRSLRMIPPACLARSWSERRYSRFPTDNCAVCCLKCWTFHHEYKSDIVLVICRRLWSLRRKVCFWRKRFIWIRSVSA